ncbi:glycerate kinase [Micrococcales bacterium 31B]|nr:glycerate kinase [Micrococcales bacterium 31B]
MLIAPDKFKGSLGAAAVAEHVAAGLRAADPSGEHVCVPIADGGEGTLEAALAAGFSRHEAMVSGPTGHPLVAPYAYRSDTRIAVVEMAQASGLAVLPQGTLRALDATSRGTGELIRAALDDGAQTIIVGIGGSACTDGGAGMLSALGVQFTDASGQPLAPGGGALLGLEHVSFKNIDPRLQDTRFVLASDVDNPLCGPRGAAAVFGPQKGATPAEVDLLDQGLRQLADRIDSVIMTFDEGAAEQPGAGAAGGVGYAALAVLEAERRAGIDVVLDLVGFDALLPTADLVITGEGSLDGQSLGGKAPLGVAARAAALDIPTLAVCGVSSITETEARSAGFARVYALSQIEPDAQRSMAEAGPLVERLAATVMSPEITSGKFHAILQ